jgi:serine/threonine protein kinase
MARPPQAVPPTPFAPAEDEEFVVSEQLRRRRDELGRKMVNTYVLGDIIGKGQHGTVRKAIDKSANHDSRLVAIKSVKRTNQRAEKIHLLRKQRVANFPRDPEHVPLTARISSTENKIRKEIAIMKKCKNAHIVRLLEVIDDRTKEKIYMG